MIQGRAQGLSKHRPLSKLILIVEDDVVNADCLASIISRETAYYAFVVTNSLRAGTGPLLQVMVLSEDSEAPSE
jgi:CheY-like chemotaxis protein